MDASIVEMRKANDDGLAAADGLAVGDEFLGAFGYAKKAGYEDGSLLFNLFVSAFLHRMDMHQIRVSVSKDTNRISTVIRRS